MPTRRLILATAVVLALTAPASAAPAPACHLVRDPRGDYDRTAIGLPGTPVWPRDDQLDVVGADVAVTGDTLTVVIRIVHEAVPTATPEYARGWSAAVAFRGHAREVLLRAVLGVDRVKYYYGSVFHDRNENLRYYRWEITDGKVRGRLSPGQITMTISLDTLAGYSDLRRIRPGQPVDRLEAVAWRQHPSKVEPDGTDAIAVGPVGIGRVRPKFSESPDMAVTERPAIYRAGQRSCIRPV